MHVWRLGGHQSGAQKERWYVVSHGEKNTNVGQGTLDPARPPLDSSRSPSPDPGLTWVAEWASAPGQGGVGAPGVV
jgi:hypothetical protein